MSINDGFQAAVQEHPLGNLYHLETLTSHSQSTNLAHKNLIICLVYSRHAWTCMHTVHVT